MRRNLIQIITLAAMLLIGACSNNDAQQTLVADNAMLSTQIVDLRMTATFEADQLKQTAEYIETIVPKAERLRDELASTLEAAGINVTLNPVEANPDFTLATPRATSSAGGSQPSIIVEGTNVSPTTDAAEVQANADGAPSEAATPTVGQPMLFNLVMAEGVGSNDCALSSVTTFTPETKQIYVVATAANIAPGMTLSAQWYLGSTLLTTQDFTPKDPINNNCIWFYAEPVDFQFTPGDYHVDLLVNSSAISGAEASFTIQATGGSMEQPSGG